MASAPTIHTKSLHEWALPPRKARIDRSGAEHEAKLLEANFRFHRAFRRPEACPPWVMGQELGWVIDSPITTMLTPLQDMQIAAENEGELREAGRLLGREEMWRRGAGYIAAARTDWLRAYQFRAADGSWQGMFLPNGYGSVEWRLGFALRIPEDHFLLVTSLDEPSELAVPTGVLTARQVNRTWEGEGFSMAVRPLREVEVTRGQPIARLVLLGKHSLQARIENTDEGETP